MMTSFLIEASQFEGVRFGIHTTFYILPDGIKGNVWGFFFQYNMKCPIYTVNLVCQNQIFFISKEWNEKFP